MTQRSDWLPAGREDILAMARDWNSVVGTNAHLWGIQPAVLQGLDSLIQAAGTAFTTAKTETTRTPEATAQCKEGRDRIRVWGLRQKLLYGRADRKRRQAGPLGAAGIGAYSVKMKDEDSL